MISAQDVLFTQSMNPFCGQIDIIKTSTTLFSHIPKEVPRGIFSNKKGNKGDREKLGIKKKGPTGSEGNLQDVDEGWSMLGK